MANDFYESIFRPLLISMTAGLATSFLVSRLMQRQLARSLEPPDYRTEGPLVSVVIPALGKEEGLPRLLLSLQNQTYFPLEVIVAGARNEGARSAGGDILVFIDADCVASPDYIERLVHALEQGYVLAHGVDPCFDDIHGVASVIASKFLKARDYTTGRGVAIRKDKFAEIGGYDADCDLGQRVKNSYGLASIKLLQRAVIGAGPRSAIE